ncbi:MAG: CDP-alcohol phosphatidyltransferase family protein [Acidobacteriota bacterium]|nr:CDP-alcohol phosphatidyltransferase family protein [Acidobacteriota bacterium]
MFGASIGRGAKKILDELVYWLINGGVHPNVLTSIGVGINVLCGVLFGLGHFFWAGIVMILANLFDMLDGRVARETGQVTKFGAFLDSSLDRLSDMVVFVGIIFFYATNTPHRSMTNVFLAAVGLMFSVMVSYTSARAESLIPKNDVGFLRRPERIVLLIIGALTHVPGSNGFFANRMPAVLWILAIGNLWTFVQRMIYTYFELERVERASNSAVQAEGKTPETAERREKGKTKPQPAH